MRTKLFLSLIFTQKTIELDQGDLKFIEGIGINKIYRYVELSGFYSELLYFHKDNTRIYNNPNRSSCDTSIIANIPLFESASIRFYPNPSTGIITIDLRNENEKVNEVSSYNMVSKKVLIKYFDSSEVLIGNLINTYP